MGITMRNQGPSHMELLRLNKENCALWAESRKELIALVFLVGTLIYAQSRLCQHNFYGDDPFWSSLPSLLGGKGDWLVSCSRRLHLGSVGTHTRHCHGLQHSLHTAIGFSFKTWRWVYFKNTIRKTNEILTEAHCSVRMEAPVVVAALVDNTGGVLPCRLLVPNPLGSQQGMPVLLVFP